MKKIMYLCLSLAMFFALDCDNTNDSEMEDKEFLNTIWTLTSFEIDGEVITPVKDHLYTVQFKMDGTFSGVNDCNDFGGEYKIELDSSLVILKVGGSKVNCPNSMYLDYIEAFRDANSYEIHENRLSINYGDNSRLIFYGE